MGDMRKGRLSPISSGWEGERAILLSKSYQRVNSLITGGGISPARDNEEH